MLTIFKNTEQGLQTLDRLVNGCWINVEDPSAEEISQLEAWGVKPEMINYPLDVDEMARTEKDNGHILIVLRIPYFQGTTFDVPYSTTPLGIIITETFIVTICKRQNEIVRELINGRVKTLKTGKRNRFALYLFLVTALRYLTHLREINKTVEALEDQLTLSTRNREVLELLKYQKSLTYFTTALKSNELMMERLQRSQLFKMYEEDLELLEDVITENQQAIQMTNIAGNILSQMMDAFASIISNNLNTVMKILAAITIIMSLPTIVASFFGMNVNLPWGGHDFAFIFTIGVSAGLVALAAFIFYKLDWF